MTKRSPPYPLTNVVPIYQGRTAILIASGPTLTPKQIGITHELVTSGRAIALGVNSAWMVAPWMAALYCADWKYIEIYKDEIPDEIPDKFTSWNGHKQPIPDRGQWKMLDVPSKPGLSTLPYRVHSGNNSGYQLVNLAYLLGITRMFLIGYTMQRVNGRAHWHEDHKGGLSNTTAFQPWAKLFKPLSIDLEAHGVECYNCTPESAIGCFERRDFESAAAEI